MNIRWMFALALLAGVMGLSAVGNISTAVAAPQAVNMQAVNGACGGGQTFDQAVAGWKAHGVLDDVMRWAGIDPDGADGRPIEQLRKTLVHVRVVRGSAAVGNNTCDSGMFRPLTRAASQAAGTYVWTTRERIGKDGHVTQWFAADCGNLRGGHIYVFVKVTVTVTQSKEVQTPSSSSSNCIKGNVKIDVRNSPGAVVNVCGKQRATTKCNGNNRSSRNNGITGNCDRQVQKPAAKSVPRKKPSVLPHVRLIKRTPNWGKPAWFKVRLYKNGRYWKTVRIKNDGHAVDVGAVPKGTIVKRVELKAQRFIADKEVQQVKVARTTTFVITNWRLAPVWVMKTTVVDGSVTTGTEKFPVTGNWGGHMDVANDNQPHFMGWLVMGRNYSANETDARGWTPDASSVSFKLPDEGFVIRFVNRKKTPPKEVTPPTPTPPAPPAPPSPPAPPVPPAPPAPKNTPDLPPPPPTPADPNPVGGGKDTTQPGAKDTTSSASGPVNPDGSQVGGGEAPDPS